MYCLLPVSTIDWSISDGLEEIPIEERSEDEVREISGRRVDAAGQSALSRIELFSSESPAANPAFDVTPRRYVTSIVTELGVARPEASELARFRPKNVS